MRLIGLTGRAGSGKDAVARILATQHGYSRMSFAEPIKRGLNSMFGIQASVFEDRSLKEKPIDWIGHSPRYLMQTLGTEWARHMVNEDIWIRVAAQLLAQHRRLGGPVCIVDVRYSNEAAWVRGQGGDLWHIARPFPENVIPLGHSSELGVPIYAGLDSVLHNDRGLEQLDDEVRRALAGERVLPRLSA